MRHTPRQEVRRARAAVVQAPYGITPFFPSTKATRLIGKASSPLYRRTSHPLQHLTLITYPNRTFASTQALHPDRALHYPAQFTLRRPHRDTAMQPTALRRHHLAFLATTLITLLWQRCRKGIAHLALYGILCSRPQSSPIRTTKYLWVAVDRTAPLRRNRHMGQLHRQGRPILRNSSHIRV